MLLTVRDEESAGPEAGVTVAELSDDPEGLYASRVASAVRSTTSSAATTRRSSRPHPLSPDLFRADDQSALVVGTRIARPAALRAGEDITAGDLVQVTGPVRQFDIAALEEDPGVDLTDDAFTELEDRPVIVASGVNPVPRRRASKASSSR